MNTPAAEAQGGTVRLVTARDRQGTPWDLTGRIDPLPGCAAEVPAGYRLSLLARPRRAGAEGEAIRMTARTVYPSYAEATAALGRLVAEVGADLGADGTGALAAHRTMGKTPDGNRRLPGGETR